MAIGLGCKQVFSVCATRHLGVVTRCGRICLGHKKINFRQVFAGRSVGIKEVHDDIWLVSFMEYDLGCFDLETRVLEPLENPFGPKVLPMR
jgi:putative transposase